MSPSPHIHPALAREREADIRRRGARARLAGGLSRKLPAEAAAGASILVAVAGLVALGAPV